MRLVEKWRKERKFKLVTFMLLEIRAMDQLVMPGGTLLGCFNCPLKYFALCRRLFDFLCIYLLFNNYYDVGPHRITLNDCWLTSHLCPLKVCFNRSFIFHLSAVQTLPLAILQCFFSANHWQQWCVKVILAVDPCGLGFQS